jgi:steroid delta-isomerase-like uncharacterized protein
VTQDAPAVARAWLEFIDAGDLVGLRSLYAEDAYTDDNASQQRIEGADALVETIRTWIAAFPDLRGTVNNVHTAGSTVTLEATFTGTWRGPLKMQTVRRLRSTNRPMTVSVCEVMEIEDGKIHAARAYYDMMSILQQIGALDNDETSSDPTPPTVVLVERLRPHRPPP